VSGEVPTEPVVSVKSGHIYEKRLILQHLQQNGHVDPTNTDQPLEPQDLLPVTLNNPTVKPRPPAATSVPNLLLTLQNEWDAVMLESYNLKVQLHSCKKQLSNALYENDAAKRVIARLVKERDEARAQLSHVVPVASKGDVEMEQAPPAAAASTPALSTVAQLPAAIATAFDATSSV
jgi:pre-mRNA-processing factor 19